ncbi:MAG: peptidylprolyl isomerase [Bacteroidota bacterium]
MNKTYTGASRLQCSPSSFLLSRPLVLLLLAFATFGCIPPTETTYDGVALDITDPISQQLLEFQDQHLTDSLLVYFTHDNPSYRYLAARAFGSFEDKAAHVPLTQLLQDPFDLVRSAAAYALGQQSAPALVDLLINNFAPDTTGSFKQSSAEILQAVGKLAPEERLEQIASVTTYRLQDTALLSGQAWAIFYFARNQVTSKEGTQTALTLSQSTYPSQVRYPALAYLSRYVERLTDEEVNTLLREVRTTQNADLRMLQVRAISKNESEGTLNNLLALRQLETDWRVSVNLLRALGNYPYADIKQALMEELANKNPKVSATAADILLAKGSAEDATTYWKLARDSFPWSTSYKLYQAANRHLPIYFSDYRGSINYQLQQRFADTNNPYEQAAIITALSDFPWNYRIIHELGFNSEFEVVRTTAVRALAYISEQADFDAFFRNSATRVRTDLAAHFQEAIETEDAGMIYEAAQPLLKKDNPFIGTYASLNWARGVLSQLPLPAAVESYRALEAAIAVLNGQEAPQEYDAPTFNRPIDWKIIEKAGTNPTVRIRTQKGNIDLQLWPEIASGTVSSFLQLAEAGFYNDKPFHRVVPNFVVQGGDPRGDGYGATDFSLRTETPPFHWNRSGIIGMASAGRDTEGVQFFITHSGTPHLDGRYTAFGQVTAGQEVVDALDIGDLIERVEIR